MNTQIDAIFNAIAPQLAIKSRLAITDLCEEETHAAGTLFIQEGQTNGSEYFLIEGVVRSCLKDQDGRWVTLSFFEENTVLTPYVIRTREGRSSINMEAVTPCKLLRLDSGRFEALIEVDLSAREFANIVLKNELSRKVDKEIQLISYSSLERLKQFRADFHMLENRVPHAMIASYLGITPVSLSRLRSTLSTS